MARAKLTRAMAYLKEQNYRDAEVMLQGAIEAWDWTAGEIYRARNKEKQE